MRLLQSENVSHSFIAVTNTSEASDLAGHHAPVPTTCIGSARAAKDLSATLYWNPLAHRYQTEADLWASWGNWDL
jgi:hypothetical protein